jgi:hypothetical protein
MQGICVSYHLQLQKLLVLAQEGQISSAWHLSGLVVPQKATQTRPRHNIPSRACNTRGFRAFSPRLTRQVGADKFRFRSAGRRNSAPGKERVGAAFVALLFAFLTFWLLWQVPPLVVTALLSLSCACYLSRLGCYLLRNNNKEGMVSHGREFGDPETVGPSCLCELSVCFACFGTISGHDNHWRSLIHLFTTFLALLRVCVSVQNPQIRIGLPYRA